MHVFGKSINITVKIRVKINQCRVIILKRKLRHSDTALIVSALSENLLYIIETTVLYFKIFSKKKNVY